MAETDDLGDFRVAGLPSGRYKVTYSGGRVAVTGGSVSPFAPAPEEQIVEARSGDETFVSLTDRTAARLVSAPKLVVTPAALAAAIDSARVEGISLNTTTASSSAPATQGGVIRGRVTGPDGQAVAGAMVRLMSSAMVSRTSSTVGAAAAVAFSEKFATTDAQGRYELRNVADGHYVLLVRKAGLAQAKDIDAPATDTWRGTELSIRAMEQQNRVDVVLVKGGIVSGRVMDSTGRPVAGASVRSETGGSEGSPVSDAQGRYELRDLPAGALSIVVSRPLTASGSFDGNETMQRRTIVLGEGQRLDGVDLVLPKGGVISGRILDELGEPVEGLSVRALQAQTVGGRTLARPVGRVAMRKTDDRGQYRIYGLPPGTFYIVATDRTTAATGSGVDLETSPRVYYPDRPSMTDALTVQIDGVSDAAGADITFAPARGAQIVGVALHSSGQAVTGAAILLTTGRPGVAIPEPLGSTIGPAGEFEFRHVPPGDYIVQIIGRRLWGVSEEFAAQAVSVRGTESLPLVITTSSPSTLLGRIQLEGASTSLSPSSFTLRALPADPDLTPALPVERALEPRSVTRDDWTFEITNLTGPSRISAVPPDGWWLKSVTIDGTNAADDPFTFGTRERTRTDVEVVFSSGAASVTGRVVDARDRAVVDGSVMVFPTDTSRIYPGSRFLRLVRSGQGGRYSVPNLPPGDYWAVAVSDVAADGQSADVLSGLIADARMITLADGKSTTVDLRLAR